jgi:hypothetical protein
MKNSGTIVVCFSRNSALPALLLMFFGDIALLQKKSSHNRLSTEERIAFPQYRR